MAKTSLLKLRPLLLTLIVMVLLALAWLPTGQFLPSDRSNKPYLHISYGQVNEADARINATVNETLIDLRNRLYERHEWQLRDKREAYAWHLKVEVRADEQLQLIGQLFAPEAVAAELPEGQKYRRLAVTGPLNRQSQLVGQFVDIVTDLMEQTPQEDPTL